MPIQKGRSVDPEEDGTGYAIPYSVSLRSSAAYRRHTILHTACLYLVAVDRQVTPVLILVFRNPHHPAWKLLSWIRSSSFDSSSSLIAADTAPEAKIPHTPIYVYQLLKDRRRAIRWTDGVPGEA